MRKHIILSTFLCFSFLSAFAQNYHELGIGFSGLRTWEIDPPEHILQELDYYWNPQVTYQIHILNQKIALGTAFGLAYETGSFESSTDNRFEKREDRRRSLILDLFIGYNFWRNKKSYFQISTGSRITNTYYFKHHMESEEMGSSRKGGYTMDYWQSTRYDVISALAYQRVLIDKRGGLFSLNLRFSWNFFYALPLEKSLGTIENNFASFSTGPSFSLVWRIKKGKKNRGLF